jgi:cytoskeletal protein CcmA (bactofilin family)
MFSSNKKPANAQVSTLAETIIGKGTKISGGSMTGEASVRIDGEFFGTIDIGGDLILGEEGRVEGDIKTRSAMIAGYARSGLVSCTDSLHIVTTGSVYGDLEVGSLVVDEGAVFIGNCKMQRSDSRDDAAPNGASAIAGETRYELPEYVN